MDHKLMNGNQCLNDNEKRKSYVGVFIRQLVEAEAAKYDIAYTPEDFAEAYGRRLGEWTEEDTNRSGEFITEEENRNSVETTEEAKADLWRFLHVPENIVPMVSSYAGFRKLRAGEYGKEEPSGLSDDEIIRKAGADGYGEKPRIEIQRALDGRSANHRPGRVRLHLRSADDLGVLVRAMRGADGPRIQAVRIIRAGIIRIFRK